MSGELEEKDLTTAQVGENMDSSHGQIISFICL